MTHVCGRFVLTLLLVGLSSQALGQARACFDRAKLLERLDVQYQETPIARGLTQTSGVLEVLSTADGSTWSLVVTYPSGVSCLVASGKYWQAIPAAIPGETT